jgi:hypothetical protein
MQHFLRKSMILQNLTLSREGWRFSSVSEKILRDRPKFCVWMNEKAPFWIKLTT